MAQDKAPRAVRNSDGFLVFPVYHAIFQLQRLGQSTNAVAIQDYIDRNIPQHSFKHLPSALDEMCNDDILISQVPNNDDDDNGNDEDESFCIPVADDTDVSSQHSDGSGAKADRLNADTTGIRLRSSCRISRTRDCYCFECHRPGLVLQCAECPRVFHKTCVRAADQLDVPLLKLREPIPDVVKLTFQQTFDREYDSARVGLAANADDPLATRLCIRCRLVRRNQQHLRPLTPPEELNELLNKSFVRIKLWLAHDTFSGQEKNSLQISSAFVRLLAPVLFARKRTVADIGASIAARRYRSLVEYLADWMDVLHCIGILRGTRCAEYEAAKYLYLDVLHDITEMARCQDCFNSSCQRTDGDWFVRPCTVPHQLVYAKLAGFSYWPAKVIRKFTIDGVVQFDVRFFGKDHARATIVERSVVFDGSLLPAQKKTAGLKTALAEMDEHKELLDAQQQQQRQHYQQLTDGVDANAAVAVAAPLSIAVPAVNKRGRGRPRKEPTPAKTTPSKRRKSVSAAVAAERPAMIKTRRSTMGPSNYSRPVPDAADAVFRPSAKRGLRSAMTASADASESIPEADIETEPPAPKRQRTLVKLAANNNAKQIAAALDKQDVASPVEKPVEPPVEKPVEPPVEKPVERRVAKLRTSNRASTETASNVETTTDDEEDGGGWSAPDAVSDEDDVAVGTSGRRSAALREPSSAAVIAKLRRKMGGCPPQFVAVAVDALRVQLALFEKMRNNYERRLNVETKSTQQNQRRPN